MTRGVEQRDIYLDDHDRIRFLALLRNVIDDCRWQLLAYVLMSNHYHLLFQTPEPNLSRGMKDLDGDYASAFNVRHRRVGHLFQGRFKGHLVDSETYLLEVARYIVLNPVRAQMVESAAEWRWSSYRATAGLIATPSWLDPQPILERFHPTDRGIATSTYREFVAAAAGQTSSPWEGLVAQAFLGGSEFLQKVEERARGRHCSGEHPRDQRLVRATTIESIKRAVADANVGERWPPRCGSDERLAFVVLAERHTNATRAEIGRHLGITGQGVGYLMRTTEARLKEEIALQNRILAIESKIEG